MAHGGGLPIRRSTGTPGLMPVMRQATVPGSCGAEWVCGFPIPPIVRFTTGTIIVFTLLTGIIVGPGHTGNRCRDGNGITAPTTGMMFPIVTRLTNRVRIHQSPGSMESLTRNRTGHRETDLKADPEASICQEKMIGFLSIKINGQVLPGWALRTISIMEAVRVLQKESRPIFQEKTTLRPIITVLPVDMAILQAPGCQVPVLSSFRRDRGALSTNRLCDLK